MNRFYLPLVFFISFLNAQPGDNLNLEAHVAKKQQLETALQNDPNNMSLRWERLNLTFDLYIDLYRRGKTFDEFQQEPIAYPYYILEDVNYLIANKVTIQFKNKLIYLADYYFRRGKYHYATGYPQAALNDYLAALAQSPNAEMKREICLAIAAYYYNLRENPVLENYQKALSYLDLITPEENSNRPTKYQEFNQRKSYYFQTEKIKLLKITSQNVRLATYLKNIAKDYLYFYKNELKKDANYQKNHSYTISSTLQSGLEKLYELAVYFDGLGDYERSKSIIEKIIDFIPKNAYGECYEMYTYGKYFMLLSKIYSTQQYQNVSLEIEHLLTGFGDPKQGLGFKVDKNYERLEELLHLYPEEPKLHLAKAIYSRKSLFDKALKKTDVSPFESLRRSEELGLRDYRIPYLKAIILADEKKYTEALVEINKAIRLHVGHANMYNLKLALLIYGNDKNEAEIERTTLLFKASKEQKVDISGILAMIDTL